MAASFLFQSLLLATLVLVNCLVSARAKVDQAPGAKMNFNADQNMTLAVRDALMLCKFRFRVAVPSLEPASLDSIVYNVRETDNFIKSNFSKMTLRGMSSLRIQSLVADTSKLKLHFKLNFTEWNITGNYNVTARFSNPTPIRGNDTFQIVAREVRVNGNSSLKKHSNGNMYVDGLKLTVEYGKANVTFNKLFKGGNSAESANKLIVVIARQVLQQTGPKVLQRLRTELQACFDNRFNPNVFKG